MLGGLIYDNITLHARAREYLPVEITNLPLDEQGNLKVSMQEKPLQTYKDSITINLYESAEGFHAGDLPFSFNPKREFLHVTGLRVVIVAWSNIPEEPYNIYDITINEEVTFSVYVESSRTLSRCWKIENLSFYQAIIPYETNYLRFSSGGYVHNEIFKVGVSIEYEYQA